MRPVILAGAGGTGATDLAAFEAGVDHTSYSLLAALRAQGLDVILVGYNDGNAQLRDLAQAVTDCVQRAQAERSGNAPLVAGGIGRGALAARYALVKLERMRMYHDTATFFSYNETAPTEQEANELNQMGDWPGIPRKLGIVSGDFTSELDLTHEGPFDFTKTGARNPGGPLVTEELGSWLVEELAH
ncbi:hypothetical protein G5C51_32020 [Streptomyces sp. A7024]|uniref:Alpha/beta hydrolase n=2 Tax=Streptomyces coryli TaxID=1128680 RepID=A0A6G4U929_9ACTN|nr:hypothetical protein [Streptomyces coryli]